MSQLPYFKASILSVLTLINQSSQANELFELSLEELLTYQIITAASGFEQKIEDAPAAVTIISDKEWQARGAINLAQALVGVPSLHQSITNVGPNSKLFMIRGLAGDFGQQVKLLIDGEPINRALEGGNPAGLQIPLIGFKRIEIIRGPGSAIYGADAYAGVINLVSYQSDDTLGQAALTYGEFDTVSFGISNNFKFDQTHLNIAFNYQKAGNDSDRIISRDSQSLFDAILPTNASRAPAVFNSQIETITLNTHLTNEHFKVSYYGMETLKFGYGTGSTQALDPNNNGENHYHQIHSSYTFDDILNGELTADYTFKYQESNVKFEMFPPGALLPIGTDGNLNPAPNQNVKFVLFSDGLIGQPDTKSLTNTFTLTHLFKYKKQHQFRWQLGYEHVSVDTSEKKNFGPGVLAINNQYIPELLIDNPVITGALTDVSDTPDVFMDDEKRDFVFISLQDEWKINSELQLNLGVRHDNYSDFGGATNYRLGAIWQVNDKLRLKTFVGTAFRAPSMTNLHYKNNPVGDGNVDLAPEKITTIETSAQYDITSSLSSILTIYHYKAQDLIAYVRDASTGISTAQNTGNITAKGAELELLWRPNKHFNAQANFSIINQNTDENRQIYNVPKQQGFAEFNWSFMDNISLNNNLKWISGRERTSNDPRENLDDYLLYNAKLTYQLPMDNLELGLTVKNLFDKKAKEPSIVNELGLAVVDNDYPLFGRQILLNLTYKL